MWKTRECPKRGSVRGDGIGIVVTVSATNWWRWQSNCFQQFHASCFRKSPPPHVLCLSSFLGSHFYIASLYFPHTAPPPLPPLPLWSSHPPISLSPSIYLVIFYWFLPVSIQLVCCLCFIDDFVIWVCFVCRVLFENWVLGGDKRIFLGFGYVIGLQWWDWNCSWKVYFSLLFISFSTMESRSIDAEPSPFLRFVLFWIAWFCLGYYKCWYVFLAITAFLFWGFGEICLDFCV